MFEYKLSLMEAMEILFPPVRSEVEKLPPRFREMYFYFRRAWGMLAQGPAAVIARQSDEIVFSVDALGLRPLWFGETEKEYFASSEKGVVDLDTIQRDPKPLAPGEKMGFFLHRQTFDPNSEPFIHSGFVEILPYDKIQHRAFQTFSKRSGKNPAKKGVCLPEDIVLKTAAHPQNRAVSENVFTAMGWNKADLKSLLFMAENGKERIGSTGYDGPLAGFSSPPVNLPEFFKEKVAVVTNPAIDRIRESHHFSTAVFLGGKPALTGNGAFPVQLLAEMPVILSGFYEKDSPEMRETALKMGTFTLGQIEAAASDNFPVLTIPLITNKPLSSDEPFKHLREQVRNHVSRFQSSLIILDDREFLSNPEKTLLDPFLAVAVIHKSLKSHVDQSGNLRRRVSLILLSAQLRNVHDVMIALGLGADAVSPYLAIQHVLDKFSKPSAQALGKYLQSLKSGIEEVLSTLGIHDINGYEKLFASIGLKKDLAEILQVSNFCGSQKSGFGLDVLHENLQTRRDILNRPGKRVRPEPHFYSHLTKVIRQVATGDNHYAQYENHLHDMEIKHPVSLRHLLRTRATPRPISIDQVDIDIHNYDGPLYFAAMSYGSLSESMCRAIAESAYRLNILALNGEGGELPEIMGHYRHYRGQQVASGRFGVNARMLNSVEYIEIKVGQGAKPGEGGMLPACKVTPDIGRARCTPAGIDLISPSNNHDVYSIEDLAQLVAELKTINPHARISVKIPAIPSVGSIASGIAKSGADIIDISGYDGGTGAARVHALKYAGFPIEIAVKEAHESLVRNQLRQRVEIWADGGMKSAGDVLKLILLGANRVGFGTLPLIAAGCVRCHRCQTGTCEMGITSHFRSKQEALLKGVRRFRKLQTEKATEEIVRFFGGLLEQLKKLAGQAGIFKLQEAVGKCDLLEQFEKKEHFDLSALLEKSYSDDWRFLDVTKNGKSTLIRRPRTSLTRIISDSICDAFDKGDRSVIYFDDEVRSMDRAIGTYLSGKIQRLPARIYPETHHAVIQLVNGTVPGNGLGSFHAPSIEIKVAGGAQDGTAKCAAGGQITILKGKNHEGVLLDGSVGKYFAYGAQKGLFIVQGDADVRAGIRRSGADVIIGGEPKSHLKDHLGNWAARANIKGFAFEYMTSGRGLVLGDPGPWLCSGM
ncbi:MAG TPA: glutamate synthase, partial [Bacteroidetes bacterium]|nr:glutamate synthase [Bacteroidota bacterium]